MSYYCTKISSIDLTPLTLFPSIPINIAGSMSTNCSVIGAANAFGGINETERDGASAKHKDECPLGERCCER